ncbi:MAG: adenylate/guanylate cyclase domain-containing protein [Chlamydiales bacterium]
MRYRTKLYLSLLGITFASVLLALGVVYHESNKEFLREYDSKVLSIAATTAALLDGSGVDALPTFSSSVDESRPEYLKLRKELRKVRDANRRSDIYVKWLYTFYPSPSNPEVMLYGVDTEENTQDHATPGEAYEEAAIYKLPSNFRSFYAPGIFIRDPTGVWLMASAPLINSQGKIIGGVEVDIKAQDVLEALHKLLMFGFSALGISSVVAITLAFFLSRAVTKSLTQLGECIRKIESGNLEARVILHTHDEFQEMALAINDMAKGLQERERLKMGFARYVSQHVLEKILQSESSLKLEGERRKITMLFSDIRQFTTLSEKLPPEQVVTILNQYFAKMIEVIFTHHGTLDKFLGDGLMVEFGAPLEDEKQEFNAVTCAVEMQKELKKLCDEWEKLGRQRIEIGVGVHTGFAVVGNIGSEKRIEYTAIGDTVNVAARLEQATKELKVPILISETTYSALPREAFKFKNLGPLQMHNRATAINVYTILDV